MKPPCEIVVKKILPVIRSMLANDISARHGLSQKQIADRLGITQPAVSQYLKSHRGSGSEVGDLTKRLSETELDSKLKKLSDKIVDKTAKLSQIVEDYCELCNTMGKKQVLCALHVEDAPYLEEEECGLCFGTEKNICRG